MAPDALEYELEIQRLVAAANEIAAMTVITRLATWWAARWRKPQSLGDRGEDAAARYLRRQGYKIVARGARVAGELDIVAVDGRTVVFVEVKTRQTDTAGAPAAAVDQDKQARLTRAATGFLKRHGLLGQAARFDVIAVRWPAGDRQPSFEHFKNAFPAVNRSERPASAG
jgi:putative endonuclease